MYRVRVAGYGWPGAPSLNTFYFVNSADPTITDSAQAQVCVDNVRAALNVAKNLLGNGMSWAVAGEVDVLDPATGDLTQSFGVTAPLVVSDNGQGAIGPSSAMMLLSLHTGTIVNGKRVRGRCYLGPTVGANDTDGTPLTVQRDFCKGIGNQLLGGTGGAPKYVVWHRPVNGAGGVAAAVTSASCPDFFAVMRSRRA